jgi:LPXTG-motif cell wall-anchored protein
MDQTTVFLGIGAVVALGLYLMRRRSRMHKDD